MIRSRVLNKLLEGILTDSNNEVNYQNITQRTMSKALSNASLRITKPEAKLRKHNPKLKQVTH